MDVPDLGRFATHLDDDVVELMANASCKLVVQDVRAVDEDLCDVLRHALDRLAMIRNLKHNQQSNLLRQSYEFLMRP